MLKLFYALREMDFSALMNIYSESNRENGRINWPGEEEGVRLLLAEQEFRQYLKEVFFVVPGAVYAVWLVNGQYVSALRLEPYKDGLLLEGLETAPDCRRMGYAAELIRHTLNQFPDKKIYSHIEKRNRASIAVHEKCGFRKVLDTAVYVDGSVTNRAFTYLFES